MLAQGRDNLILLIPPGPANVWCMVSAGSVPEGLDAMKAEWSALMLSSAEGQWREGPLGVALVGSGPEGKRGRASHP